MIMDSALVHQHRINPTFPTIEPWLRCGPSEDPIAVQLGGGGHCDSPHSVNEATIETFCQASELVVAYGQGHNAFPFKELNVNSGCPSGKAVSRGFGADLMRLRSSDHTRALLYQACRRVGNDVDVTLKCRIGCTEYNERPGKDARLGYDMLRSYVDSAVSAGVKKVVLHSRICVLNGFSTGKNRTVPPLAYDVTRRVARDFPSIDVVVNGGVENLAMAEEILKGEYAGRNSGGEDELWGWREGENLEGSNPAGVMVGRWAYNDVCGMWDADSRFYGKKDRDPTFRRILEEYFEHCEGLESKNNKLDGLPNLVKPLHNVFCGLKGNKQYKQDLDQAVKEWGKGGGGKGGIREVVEDVLGRGHIKDEILEGPISAQRSKENREK